MKIKNKSTGFIFEINDKEGKILIEDDPEKFEPLDKKFSIKKKKQKTIKEKVMGTECLLALTKNQIKQELDELSVKYSEKATKKELVEILKKTGGY